MFNKAMQELVKLAPAGNIRPTLAGLYFKGNTIAVTDSFKLMEVTVNPYDIGELPKNTNSFKFLNMGEIDFMIPTETIKNIKMPKSKNFKQINQAYFGNLNQTEDGEIQNVGIMTNDLEREIITQTRVLKSKFPNYPSFFENDGTLEIGMDVNHLIDLLTVFKKLGHRQLKFKMGTPLQPIIIEGEPIDQLKNTRAILMPLKI